MGSGRPGVEPLRGQRRDGGRRVAPPETEPALVKTGVCRIERRRTVKGRTQATVSYAVTSVAPAVGGADRLLRVLRKHWDIENRVHWVRDVTFDEDRSQVRTGNAPQVMAAFRNLTSTLVRWAGHTNVAAALRRHAAHVSEALALVGISPCLSRE